jgi:demethylmenaquinone methyltransferase/2-methoxy-6-polyprenyl-1,4-benzoquinol methylase
MAEFAHDRVVPFSESALSKKEQVAGMFDNIAQKYDLLNRLLSGGTDRRWRKKAIKILQKDQPQTLLDIATGTGDMAIMAAAMLPSCRITGMDISEGMLEVGRKKIKAQKLEEVIELLKGDGEAINAGDNSFDAVMVAFGVRNFQDLRKGLSEMRRVLRPGGKMMILEFSKPKNPIIAPWYRLYMKTIAPLAGKLFSKNAKAYKYLNNSIQKFPEGDDFLACLKEAGFNNPKQKPLSFGICSIYYGIK